MNLPSPVVSTNEKEYNYNSNWTFFCTLPSPKGKEERTDELKLNWRKQSRCGNDS